MRFQVPVFVFIAIHGDWIPAIPAGMTEVAKIEVTKITEKIAGMTFVIR